MMNFYNFYTGNEFAAYEYLGAHVHEQGTTFRTFAPNARAISVIGDFNGWQETPMGKIYDGNFWECSVPNAASGMRYKFRIYSQDGKYIDHCDPYAFGSELRPNTASVIRKLSDYQFADSAWLEKRNLHYDDALNMYELHFGSWRRKENGAFYSYSELADKLIPYLKDIGYNYIEIMPLCEHPCDNSWGYQQTGYFCPTSRYGDLNELKAFVDKCHNAHIGVILDFVPVHFAVDDYALSNYDGTPLFEYPHADVGRSEWGSCNFMLSRGEVRSFLNSSAYFWLKEFHFDGLRLDAVSNLIYWQGDKKRGENKSAIAFIKAFNGGLKARMPSAMLIAEDSSSFPNVTKPVSGGGLGFDYKWAMGWMNDVLSYFQMPPELRKTYYHKLTFSMAYFYNERYVLPFSHDENVHGKGTILQKMHGEHSDKFSQVRALYLFMYAHIGKKLNFMGGEFGQLREWDENRPQDWDLLQHPAHDSFRAFMRDVNTLYLNTPALSRNDYAQDGFEWIDCNLERQCVYSFKRIYGKQQIIFVFNFSGEPQSYALKPEANQRLTLLIDTNAEKYGGDHKTTKLDGKNMSLSPYCGLAFALHC